MMEVRPPHCRQVLQGERPMARDNKILNIFRLENLPSVKRGQPIIEVTFEIDSSDPAVGAFRSPTTCSTSSRGRMGIFLGSTGEMANTAVMYDGFAKPMCVTFSQASSMSYSCWRPSLSPSMSVAAACLGLWPVDEIFKLTSQEGFLSVPYQWSACSKWLNKMAHIINGNSSSSSMGPNYTLTLSSMSGRARDITLIGREWTFADLRAIIAQLKRVARERVQLASVDESDLHETLSLSSNFTFALLPAALCKAIQSVASVHEAFHGDGIQ